MPYSALQQPIAIGGKQARNRLMMTTHGPRLGQARYLRYLEERARGGIALAGFNLGPQGIMQFPLGPGRPNAAEGGDGDAVPPHPLTAEGRAHYDAMIPTIRAWRDVVAKHGTLAVGQLYHPGIAQHSDNFQPSVGPTHGMDDYERKSGRGLSPEQIADLIEAYALGAKRAVAAGYDLIEVHAAHGYMGHQFLSPLFNRRTDRYGGSFENRYRFLAEMIAAVTDKVAGAVPIGLRLTGPDSAGGGLTLAEVIETAKRAEAAGMAYVSISGGTYSGLLDGMHVPYVAPALIAPGPNVPTAKAVRQAVKIPVMVAARIADIDLAERIVAGGDADLVGMVRALMADPRLPEKAFSGNIKRAIPCIACNECHYGRPVTCSTNPATGREAALEAAPAAAARNILVVGAGPAGIECALTAAKRGHHVTLADRRRMVGGALVDLAKISAQSEFGKYLDYAAQALADSAVALKLGVEIDAAYAEWLGADVVVLATGARYAGLPHGALSGAEAAAAPEKIGRRVVVAGGKDDHLAPLLLADHLARSGRQVTLLSEVTAPGSAVEPASLNLLLRRLSEMKVAMLPLTAAVRRDGNVVTTRNSYTGQPGSLDNVDTLIVADGLVPEESLAAALKGKVKQLHLIGDALAPRRMLHATLDGARLGIAL